MVQRSTARTAALYVALGLCLLYLPFYLSDSVYYGADQYPFFFTGQRFWWESFHRFGSLPLWNSYINLGTSFLYNPTWGVFYPPHFVQAVVSPPRQNLFPPAAPPLRRSLA